MNKIENYSYDELLNSLNNNVTIFLEQELINELENFYDVYVDLCDLDEDRMVDIDDFSKEAKEAIEKTYGILKFGDFDIEDYANSIAQRNNEIDSYIEILDVSEM